MEYLRLMKFSAMCRYVVVICIVIMTCHSTTDHSDHQNSNNANDPSDQEPRNLPGHLEKFGSGKQGTEQIDETEGFPSVQDFFNNYAFISKPLIMRNAGKLSPGFSNWATDDYFLSLPVPADNTVLVETMKKEDRKQETLELNFRDFIKTYNSTEHYMVNNVPDFLLKDVVIPWPLQCDFIYDNIIVDAIMWFSSGGTKSVVHTDAVENINCLYSGKKEFVMVDPFKFKDKAHIDHPEGAYSSVDVDSVDYTKYPGLAEVEYQLVMLAPGDCLYIPYKWIHQVRSFNRNIAVNIWWNYHMNKEVNVDDCPTKFDPTLTLEQVTFHGFDDITDSIDAIKDHFSDLLRGRAVDIESFITLIVPERDEIEEMNPGIGYTLHIKKIFEIFDRDGDGQVSGSDIQDIHEEAWEQVRDQMRRVDTILRALDAQWQEQMQQENFYYHEEL